MGAARLIFRSPSFSCVAGPGFSGGRCVFERDLVAVAKCVCDEHGWHFADEVSDGSVTRPEKVDAESTDSVHDGARVGALRREGSRSAQKARIVETVVMSLQGLPVLTAAMAAARSAVAHSVARSTGCAVAAQAR